MRSTFLNAVDDKGVYCLFCETFRKFGQEVSAKTCLFNWVQGGFLLRISSWGGGRTGVLGEVGSAFSEVGEGECKALVFWWGNGDGSLFPIYDWVYCFKPGMSQDCIFPSSIDDIETDLLGNTSELDIDGCLMLTSNVGGPVGVSNGEGVFQGFGGDFVLLYEGPVYTIDLGSRVDDYSGVTVFHSEGGNDEFHFNVQGILLSRGTTNGNGEFLHRGSSPFQKSWL